MLVFANGFRKLAICSAALVFGPSGHFCGEAARAFEAAGWAVRRYRRGTGMRAEAAGRDPIGNGMSQPHCHAWDRLVPGITDAVLAAAQGSGAGVLIPGNVYVFGTRPAPWSKTTPHRPVARKGRIRAEMEAHYRDAAETGVRTIPLRAGDFIGPDRAGGLVDRFVIGSATTGRITSFGDPDAVHAWACLPDMARAVALAARAQRLRPSRTCPSPVSRSRRANSPPPSRRIPAGPCGSRAFPGG